MTLPIAEEREAAGGLAEPRRLAKGWRARVSGPALLFLPALAGLTLALSAWEAWIQLRDIEEYLVPAPSAVAERLYAEPWLFIEEGIKTLEGAMLGFAVGAFFAITLATIMAQSRMLERALFPLAILIKVTPIVAVAPLLTIWFGFGLMPKVFIAALIVFFPIMVNALVGFSVRGSKRAGAA